MTGGASGIGAAVVELLLKIGAIPIVLDLNSPHVDEVEFIAVDLADAASIDAVVARLDDRYDGLCNIAGLPPTAPPEKVIAVNYLGCRLLTAKLSSKLSPGSAIVNLASSAGRGWKENYTALLPLLAADTPERAAALCTDLGIDEHSSYFLSKQALIAWTCRDWNKFDRQGLRINCVSPGPVDSPILPDFVEMLGERARFALAAGGRAGKPGEIAPLVGFLLAPESSWIKGTDLAIDGGYGAVSTFRDLDATN